MSKVPIVKNFTMGDCMAAQRRCENSSFEHAHYGALRCVTCAYRPVKGVLEKLVLGLVPVPGSIPGAGILPPIQYPREPGCNWSTIGSCSKLIEEI